MLRSLRCTLVLVLCLYGKALCQDTAEIFITITDPTDAVVPGAHLTIIDSRRGTVQQADTNPAGVVSFQLSPSDYTLDVTKSGFARLRVQRITLSVRDRQSLRLPMTVATETTVVTVSAGEGVTTDASLGVSLDQDYVQNLPLNGRNAESLILMVPGITSASGGRGGLGGGFNSNGLRSNLNYYTLDGVSVNSSISGLQGGPPGGPGGGGPGGPPPSAGGPGTSTSLISVDAMQEMRVQTSPFAPEFGRSPGAQVSMTSRSGSNAFHGSAFYYFRNDRMNANDWFANSAGYPRSTSRQNRPGATFGGPLQKKKTFIFLSYERLKALAPSTVVASVPDLATRANTPAALRAFVNAFPLPNGPELTDGAAQFRAVVLTPSNSQSASLRLDHAWSSRTVLFLRYSTSPNNEDSRGFTPNLLTRRDGRSELFTGGWTKTHSATLLEDLRVNFSTSSNRSTSNMDNFGGAVPLTNNVFPNGITSDNGQFSLNILGVGSYSLGSNSRSDQLQVNAVYSITKTSGAHIIKVGADYRRTMPTNYRKYYSQNITFNGLSTDDGGLLSGTATNVQVSSNLERVYPLYSNFSAYGQDTFRATDRTTVTYGLRWDVNPAPGVRQGPRPFALNPDSAIGGVTQNEPLYSTKWLNIAPRVGLAYQADTTEGREMMLRMGFGFFYDVGYGSIASSFAGAPYSSVSTISSATLPLTAAEAAPPALPPGRPYGQVSTADSALKAPLISQYNFIVERSFGRGQQLSVGYVGTLGRRLMRTQSQPSFSSAYDLLMETTNGANSSYNGLQVQFRKRISARIQIQLSYTYGHSIDSSSNDAGFGGGFASLFGEGERGSSDYDIRHNLNFSGMYRLPAPSRGFGTFVLRNWFLDWVATARTGLPFDVMGVSSDTSSSDSTTTNSVSGIFAQVRPDYTGAPVWIDDAAAPGGRKLNAAAFLVPDGFAQGNLGRNVIRGFSSRQLDLSIRRQIPITEHLMMNLSVQAFNVTNHPNFANPSPQEGSNLSSPNFGVVTRMLNQAGPGGGGSVSGSGGPRSIELAVRFQF